MGDIITRRIYKNFWALMFILMALFGTCVTLYMTMIYHRVDDRQVRVAINSFVYQVEQQDGTILKGTDTSDFEYAIFSMNGVVLESSIHQYAKGERVNLHTIGGSKQYMVPLVINGESKGFFLFLQTASWSNHFHLYDGVVLGVLLLLFLVALFLAIRIRLTMRRDIWQPIKELRQATTSILNWNLEQRVLYDYEGEIGKLCHDFEGMRDELKNQAEREQEWKEKEKTLYACISHDLKTPLAIVRGYMEELRYDVVTEPERVKETLDKGLKKVDILNQLVDDILEHSKVQLNQMSIEPVEVFTRQYFEKLLATAQDEVRQGGGTLEYELPPDMLVLIDPNRMQQVMQNLIGNAIKYCGEDAFIRISFEVYESEQTYLIAHVDDNGPGIEAKDIPYIFDMFYRGNKARTQDIPGSGIGLHITKYIVEQQGGSIECDSVWGKGTKMSFSMPVA